MFRFHIFIAVIFANIASANSLTAIEQDWLLREKYRPGKDSKALTDAKNCSKRIDEIADYCQKQIDSLAQQSTDVSQYKQNLKQLLASEGHTTQDFFRAKRLQRKLTLADEAFDFDDILFVKRKPGWFNHMSDQYFGWWSRPGGGIYILRDFKSDDPQEYCITDSFTAQGSFLRPAISYDGKKVLFAWCKYYERLAGKQTGRFKYALGEQNKFDKSNVPEDAFYHLYEMNIDGTNAKRLTSGKYDNFDARYLPDGKIVFLSTRRGHAVQCGLDSATRTMEQNDLPDVYVRCGGGLSRPCAVYTLHTIDADGKNLNAISPFEMFEWTPSLTPDGRILYSRWDYIDRWNNPYMSLWSINPDGTNSKLVYGNYTISPHCTFEPMPIPNSNKIIFTASAHHAQTMGSLVLLDTSIGTEGADPITRLTPEVVFPEAEGWPKTFYKNPWPLSERFYLTAWSNEGDMKAQDWDVGENTLRAPNGMGIYAFDAQGNMEMITRDPEIGSVTPIPLRKTTPPAKIPSKVDWLGPKEGTMFVSDVYRGLKTVKRGDIKAIRIIAVPPKTHPKMHYPPIGLTRDDPGKCVLGTVPVEPDGSAYFKLPAGVIVFFQALDKNGMAVQTMRSVTYVQPGEQAGCIGCHEPRHQAAPVKRVVDAVKRLPSQITPGPSGSWPLRFDKLVGGVIENNCKSCHNPKSKNIAAAKFDLTEQKAYETLVNYGKPSLKDKVNEKYKKGYSVEGDCMAMTSAVLKKINDKKIHPDLSLNAESTKRLIIWMDSYAQKAGSFSEIQEKELLEIKKRCQDLSITSIK
ncbi:MAG: hypothetical protein FVQ82_10670 [Planctomycetes bacterium]|nr:hypothetical protein [Planctomycetota bacterium]